MSWYPTTYALVALTGAAVPAVVGAFAWQRRLGNPGAATLAALLWVLALWGLTYALELGTRSAETAATLYEVRSALLVAAPPLWLVFVLQYTGRERWLTLPNLALLAAVPVATLALIFTNEAHGLVWSSEAVRDVGGFLAPDFEGGPMLWVGLGYSALLVLAGVALLVLMFANSWSLYRKQSLCLFFGFVGPWAAYAAYALGLQLELSSLPGLNPMVLAYVPAGVALAGALYRYQLLDISPVAHDSVVEGMNDGTLVLDQRNRIVDLNPSAARILRCSPDEVLGQGFREVMRSKAASFGGKRAGALLKRYEEQGQAHEEVTLGKGEGAHHYDLALSARYDGRGRPSGHLVVLHEITEQKLAVERLDRMAHYDALTGLPNRTLFYERLNQEIARARRTSSPGKGLLALMFLDLDRFKMINDTLGHDVGDLLLQETAQRLKNSLRPYDTIARLAGDEFTVILPDLSRAREATDAAGRIISAIAAPFHVGGDELLVTTSIGVCFYPTDGHDPTLLLKNADAAMYRAKAAGKNCFEVFTEDVLLNPTKHLEMENELIQSIDEDRFVLHYQPEIEIASGRAVGVEALVRWEHPERGLVPPTEFIPVAEETGLIFSIERWALREACRQMYSWQERYPTTDAALTTSVNLSRKHFMHPNLAGMVAGVLEETGLPPECLILEIQESVLHEDAASAIVTLAALKKLGVTLAVDNFGVGYSSLQHLKRFPLDILKIDSFFTRSLHESEDDRRVVSAVISLAHALDLKVVASGVEYPRQLMLLREMGCEIAQGTYFAGTLSHRATSAFLVADLYY